MVIKLKRVLSATLILFAVTALTACTIHAPGVKVQEPETQPTTVLDYTEATSENYSYRRYSDHIEIYACAGKPTSIRLPATLEGLKVTSFGTAFKRSLTLTSISIPASYEEIETEAFAECYKLKNVAIQEGSMKTIGDKAFYGCQALSTIRIPKTVTEIADTAFKYCTDLFIYGEKGSAAEQAAEKYNSIYFRNINEATTAAAKKPAKTTAQADAGTDQPGTTTTGNTTTAVNDNRTTTVSNSEDAVTERSTAVNTTAAASRTNAITTNTNTTTTNINTATTSSNAVTTNNIAATTSSNAVTTNNIAATTNNNGGAQ